MADIIQIRRDLAANWTSADPTLAQGEMGYETDTGLLKFGDGSTAWTSLAYFALEDSKVKVDSAATADYIGSLGSDGVLRTDATLNYADGGDFVTISLDSTLKSNYDTGYSHSQVVTGNPHSVTKSEVGLSNVPNTDCTNADNISDGATNAIVTLTQESNFETAYTHANGSTGADHTYIDQDLQTTASPTFAGATIVNAINELSTDGTLAGDSDSAIPTEKAVKAYADNLLSVDDALVFKGVIDCSTNPNYPAADKGHTYKVSVAGKLGGASGEVVEVGDTAYCITDSSPSGDQAAVGANWTIVQTNIDGAVTGPSSSTDSAVALFDSTTGKLIKNSVVTVDGSGNITTAGNVDGVDVGTDVPLNTTHRGLTNNPHSVTKTQVGLSNVPNTDCTNADNISDGSTNAIVTLTQESNFETAYSHVSADGSSHGFIDQDVTIGSSPTLDGTNITGIISGEVDHVHLSVRKGSAGTISALRPVYVTGYNPSGYIEVEEADNSDANKMPAIGIAETDITNAATVFAIILGELSGINTSAYSDADELYVAAGAALTTTKPTGTALIQKIAQVNRSNVAVGSLSVYGPGRTNDVPNIPSNEFWLGNGSGVATPTNFDTKVSANTDVTSNTTHSGIVTGNPHAVTQTEVGLGNVTNNAQYYPGGADVAITDGGTGQSTQQAAIDALTAVSGAANEHVLTKDTATGNAVFKAAASGGSDLEIDDEGTPLTTAATKNFAGAGVTATEPVTNEILVTIPGGGTAADMATAQARRTTTYTVTTAWVDLTLDTTDVENDNTIIDHDNVTNTDRITVKETGVYLISYHIDLDNPATNITVTVNGRVRVNDTTVIDGSIAHGGVMSDAQADMGDNSVNTVFIADLTANDYVTLQLRKIEDVGTGTYDIQPDAILNVTRLSGAVGATGATGATGAAGADGDITWEGAWVTSTAYTTNQAVENDGSSYVCISNHTSGATDEPGVGASWETYWELMASKGDVGSPGDMSVVQARRTTTYSLTTSFADITLDTTDVENDSTVVEHDTATDRITCKETGVYLVTYHMDLPISTAATSVQVDARVRVNDTSVVNGSEATTESFLDASVPNAMLNDLGTSSIADLTANDYLTLQLQKIDLFGASTLAVDAGIILTVTRLTGAVGPTGATGATGADGDITWESSWVTSTAYTTNQAVENNGSSYVCILNHTASASDEPGVGGSWTTYWDLLAAKGTTGTAGADGDITWESAWVTSTAYTTNQATENDGSSYVCILNHTSSATDEPGVGASWETYWDLMSSKGDTGTTTATNQTIAYAASITPNANSGTYMAVGQLTGNITVNAMTNADIGKNGFMRFNADGTDRTITWNANYLIGGGTGTTSVPASTTTLVYWFGDGTNVHLAIHGDMS